MKNIYLFHGEDKSGLKKELNLWTEAFAKKHSADLNLSVIKEDKPDINKILSEIKTVPFMGDKRLVIAYNIYSNCDSDEFDKFIEAIKEIPESTILVLIEEPALRKNAKIIKRISKLGEVKEFKKSKYSLKKDFKKIITKQGKQINDRDLDELIFNLGENQNKIQNEALKLSLGTEGERITKEDIDRLVSFDPQISVFKLMDNLSQKEIKKSLNNLVSLVENGEDLVRLFYLLARQIRILIQVKYLYDLKLPPREIAKATELKPFIINKTISQVKNFSYEKLAELLKELLEIDIKIKTGQIKYSKDNKEELLFEIEKFLIDTTK